VARKRIPIPLNPFLAWTDLALRTAETLAASAHVISHRSSRPASAAQVYGMGSEKVVAAMLSSNAMMRHWVTSRRDGHRDPWSAYVRMLSKGLAPIRARAMRNSKRYSGR
jgi:hypothetical protein